MKIGTVEVELKPKDIEGIKNKIKEDLINEGFVEVVRCKDCKYWRPDTRPEDSLEERTDGLWGWGNLCVKHLPNDELEAIEFGPEEFCNFGKRKDELMSTLQVINPRLYKGVMRKIED